MPTSLPFGGKGAANDWCHGHLPKNEILNSRLKPKHGSLLYSGAKFHGEQSSGRHSYSVLVELKDVDLSASMISGYLTINGLTEENPQITTFFEAEIIGPKHQFLTRKWDADEEIDRQHWSRFPSFQPLQNKFQRRDFNFDSEGSDHVYMRWKELFLVPNHRIKSIPGASFSGFYYICLSKTDGEITGFYFHQNSELFQALSLKHVPTHSFASFEYR